MTEDAMKRTNFSGVISHLLLLLCILFVRSVRFTGLFLLYAGDDWDYIMSEVQGTLEFSVELHKFHNVDLFQRG